VDEKNSSNELILRGMNDSMMPFTSVQKHAELIALHTSFQQGSTLFVRHSSEDSEGRNLHEHLHGLGENLHRLGELLKGMQQSIESRMERMESKMDEQHRVTERSMEALRSSLQRVDGVESKDDRVIAKVDTRCDGMERRLDKISHAVGIRNVVNVGDDNEDRKRLKMRLKEALTIQNADRVSACEPEGYLEYFLGIRPSNGRIGKQGSRYGWESGGSSSKVEALDFFGCRLIHPQSRFMQGELFYRDAHRVDVRVVTVTHLMQL
jgi:hypothetical protein